MIKAVRNIIHLLIPIFLISGLLTTAYAQNSGSFPYQDSRHSYRVDIADRVNNEQAWSIVNESETTTYDLSDAATHSIFEYSIYADGDYDVVQIKFEHEDFAPGVWYLRYYETDNDNGECVSAREIEITVMSDAFYLLVDGEADNCNSQDGVVREYEEIDVEEHPTGVQYTVTMNKPDDFDPTSWRFDVTFSHPVTSINVDLEDPLAGTVSSVDEITENSAYRITINTSVDNPTGVVVEIDVEYSFNVLADNITRTITITNGEAILSLAGAPDAITDDNIVTYPIADPGDRVEEVVIWDIPATRNIVEGSGESVWSAEHPLQNSTHNYNVEMENFTNNTSAWRIENLDGSQTMTLGTHYTLTQTNALNVVTAEISFLGAMPTGDYYIYFTETNTTTTCSSVRRKLIHLLDPFDVDIALSTGEEILRCATISGEPLSSDEVGDATPTDVQFTASMNTPGYDAGWSFDISVATAFAGGFNAADVELTAGAIVVSGGTFTPGADNYHGSVVVAAGTTSVDITVTFSGLYVNRHDITVALSNITGSFEEDDDGTGNSVVHTIYRLPQTGILAGVD